jgi:hypothetical protein
MILCICFKLVERSYFNINFFQRVRVIWSLKIVDYNFVIIREALLIQKDLLWVIEGFNFSWNRIDDREIEELDSGFII